MLFGAMKRRRGARLWLGTSTGGPLHNGPMAAASKFRPLSWLAARRSDGGWGGVHSGADCCGAEGLLPARTSTSFEKSGRGRTSRITEFTHRIGPSRAFLMPETRPTVGGRTAASAGIPQLESRGDAARPKGRDDGKITHAGEALLRPRRAYQGRRIADPPLARDAAAGFLSWAQGLQHDGMGALSLVAGRSG